jgi:hypothetical protein
LFRSLNYKVNMRNIIQLSIILGIFVTTQSKGQTLLHYWNFNTLNTGVASAVDPATLAPIKADFTLFDTAISKIYFRATPNTPNTYTTYWDQTTGDLVNARNGDVAGNCLRPRNPTDSMQLLFFIPTTGYENINFKYIVQRSSASNGAASNMYSYSLDSGATWITTGLSTLAETPVTTWSTSPISITINNVLANNNPRFVFRIRFGGPGNTGTSGNNRFDNITVEGTAIGSGPVAPVVNSIAIVDSARIDLTFNISVFDSSARNKNNYNIIPSIAIDTVLYDSASRTSSIRLASRLVNGTSYIISANNIRSLSNGIMTNAYNSPAQFYNDYVGQDLVITEINYNSPSGDPDSLDFVEIYNKGNVAINIGGLKFFNGLDNTLQTGSIAPQSFLLIGMDSAKCRAFYNKSFIQFADALGNGGEPLTLRNSLGILLDSVNYDDAAPWPLGPPSPDGGGPSIELTSSTIDNNTASNWNVATSLVGTVNTVSVFATPGVLYTAPVIPAVAFTVASQNVVESLDSAIITLTIANSNATPTSVNVKIVNGGTATNNSDYSYSTQTVIFPANSTTSQTIKLNLNDDAISESAEYIFIQLDSVVNGRAISGIIRHTIYIRDNDYVAPAPVNNGLLTLLGSYKHNASGSHSAEIVKFDSLSKRLFIANSIGGFIDIVDFSNPLNPRPIRSVNIKTYGNINSLAVRNGLVACAIENAVPENDGFVAFFDTAGTFIKQVTVGAMPDDISFTPDGTKILTANEGQPNDAYTIDPEGSVGIVNISSGIANVTQANVKVARFRHFNNDSTLLRNNGVRIYGPGSSVAQDMEPEYLTYAPDSRKAWVSLQENNALGVIDLTTDSIIQILPLGYKDHMQAGNGLDASDQSGDVLIANWPIKGMYMPDALATINVGGVNYVMSANEGDARAYSGMDEEGTVGTLNLDSAKFPNAAFLKTNTALGRLTITTKSGDIDNDGDIDTIYAYGSRSFTIWNGTTGSKVFDSGDEMEQITAAHPIYGPIFNANNSTGTPSRKNRSDNKGPEPEGITTATINDTVYAFIALERTGGVMVYDVTNPAAPRYVTYQNNRNITSGGVDVGSEGIIYISASQSPNGKPLVLLANEVSSTLSIFQLNTTPTPATINVAQSTATFNEASGFQNIAFSLSKPAPSAGALTLRVTNGSNATSTDYLTNPPTVGDSIVVPIAANATSLLLGFLPTDDTIDENNETVSFEIIRATGNFTVGSSKLLTVTIEDNDTTIPARVVGFATASTSVVESSGSSNVLLNLNAPLNGAGELILKATKGVNVTNTDFTTSPVFGANDSIIITLSNGATSASFDITVLDDLAEEQTEEVVFTIVRVTDNLTIGSQSVFTFSIEDNDSTTTALNEWVVNGKAISMYPNPNKSGIVYFSEKVSVEVFDMQGKLLKNLNKVSELNIQDLAKGMYFIKLENSISKKLIIE